MLWFIVIYCIVKRTVNKTKICNAHIYYFTTIVLFKSNTRAWNMRVYFHQVIYIGTLTPHHNVNVWICRFKDLQTWTLLGKYTNIWLYVKLDINKFIIIVLSKYFWETVTCLKNKPSSNSSYFLIWVTYDWYMICLKYFMYIAVRGKLKNLLKIWNKTVVS